MQQDMTIEDLKALCVPRKAYFIMRRRDVTRHIPIYSGEGSANQLRILHDWFRPGSVVDIVGCPALVTFVGNVEEFRPGVKFLCKGKDGLFEVHVWFEAAFNMLPRMCAAE